MSFPPTTTAGWLLVLALVLFAGAYVGVCVRRDARRTGRSRPTLWATVVGASLLASGLVGLVLLVAYLWGRDPGRSAVAGE
jgi:multisubunit Na+/H+ antiporter MnhB subunit